MRHDRDVGCYSTMHVSSEMLSMHLRLTFSEYLSVNAINKKGMDKTSLLLSSNSKTAAELYKGSNNYKLKLYSSCHFS